MSRGFLRDQVKIDVDLSIFCLLFAYRHVCKWKEGRITNYYVRRERIHYYTIDKIIHEKIFRYIKKRNQRNKSYLAVSSSNEVLFLRYYSIILIDTNRDRKPKMDFTSKVSTTTNNYIYTLVRKVSVAIYQYRNQYTHN